MPDYNSNNSSAWSEISARIQTREHVFLTFIVLTATLVGLALSKNDLAFVGVSVGYVSLATAILCRHHDLIIGQLGKYQRKLYTADTEHPNIPNWQADPFLKDVKGARSIRDWAQILFIVLGTIPALYIAKTTLATPTEIRTLLWYGSLGCSVFAVYVVIQTQIDRKRIWQE